MDKKNKYKVEFVQTEKFVVDVLADTEDEAKELAQVKWNEIAEAGIYHMYESQEAEVEIDTVYDVTNTDDPFNP